jgi:DNA polymerase III gamma/tau subunit
MINIKTLINYSNFQECIPEINNIEAILSNKISLNLNIIASTMPEEQNKCIISLKEIMGVNELKEQINKEDVRQLITLLKLIYRQLNNMDDIKIKKKGFDI